MLVTYFWPNLDVSAPGPISLGTFVAPVPGQHFVCEGGGVMKNDNVDTWSVGGAYTAGYNAPNYNNMVPTLTLTTTPKIGRCVSQPTLRACPDGTAMFLRVITAGVATPGPARIDFYMIGYWTFL